MWVRLETNKSTYTCEHKKLLRAGFETATPPHQPCSILNYTDSQIHLTLEVAKIKNKPQKTTVSKVKNHKTIVIKKTEVGTYYYTYILLSFSTLPHVIKILRFLAVYQHNKLARASKQVMSNFSLKLPSSY